MNEELKFAKVKKRNIEFEYAYREYGRSQYSGEMLYEVIIRISSKDNYGFTDEHINLIVETLGEMETVCQDKKEDIYYYIVSMPIYFRDWMNLIEIERILGEKNDT